MIATMEPIILTGEGLRIADVVSVARDGRAVQLSDHAVARMRRARAVVAGMIESGQTVYGLTTGVGALRGVVQASEDAQRYNHLTIQAHCVAAHGPPLPVRTASPPTGRRSPTPWCGRR
jgi:histidine ammonia-lyase